MCAYYLLLYIVAVVCCPNGYHKVVEDKYNLIYLCSCGTGWHSWWDLCKGEGSHPRPIWPNHMGASQRETMNWSYLSMAHW